jgi:hypothetical protein
MRGVVQMQFGLLNDVEEGRGSTTELAPATKHDNRQHLLDSLPRISEIRLAPWAARQEVEVVKRLPHIYAPAFEILRHPVSDGDTKLAIGKQKLCDGLMTCG